MVEHLKEPEAVLKTHAKKVMTFFHCRWKSLDELVSLTWLQLRRNALNSVLPRLALNPRFSREFWLDSGGLFLHVQFDGRGNSSFGELRLDYQSSRLGRARDCVRRAPLLGLAAQLLFFSLFLMKHVAEKMKNINSSTKLFVGTGNKRKKATQRVQRDIDSEHRFREFHKC